MASARDGDDHHVGKNYDEKPHSIYNRRCLCDNNHSSRSIVLTKYEFFLKDYSHLSRDKDSWTTTQETVLLSSLTRLVLSEFQS